MRYSYPAFLTFRTVTNSLLDTLQLHNIIRDFMIHLTNTSIFITALCLASVSLREGHLQKRDK